VVSNDELIFHLTDGSQTYQDHGKLKFSSQLGLKNAKNQQSKQDGKGMEG